MVSIRPRVAEKWMDRFVVDLVECPSVSRTSAVARTFRPAVSEEYSPVFFCWGGGVGGGLATDAYPLVVVESDTVQVSVLQSVESDKAQVSVLPVAGCKFPAVFLGKVAFDVVGLSVGPLCLLVDSEETLLTWTEERAPLARADPGVTPVDSSDTRTPVRELMWPSVLGESSVGCLQEPIIGVEGLEHAIQATASVWMPFEQMYNVVSGDMDFDSSRKAPWDAGGMHGNLCQPHEAIHTVKSQWSMRFSCRPAIVHGL